MNTTIQSNKQHFEDEIDFSNLIYQIIENKKIIIITTFIFIVFGLIYASQQVPTYKSDVLIQIEDNQGSSGKFSTSISSQLGSGTRNNLTAIEASLIQSRFILEPVIRSVGLDLNIRLKQNLFKRLFFPTHAQAEIHTFLVPKNKLNTPYFLQYNNNEIHLYDKNKKLLAKGRVGELLKNETGSIQLQIANISAPPNSTFQLSKSASSQIINSLASRVKIEDLGKKIGNTGILSISLIDSDPSRAARILNSIVFEAKTKDAEKKSLEASKTLEFLYHQLPIVKNSLEKAELALNEYRAKSGKIDMQLQTKSLLDRLGELDKQLATLRINEIEMIQHYTLAHPTLQALKTQIKSIKQDKLELENTLKALPLSDQVAVNLMRDVTVKNTLYTTLLNEIQQLQVAKAGMISNINILSLATIPEIPLPNKSKIIYLVSITLGLLTSIVIIFIRKLLFPRIQDPLWIENQYGIANLAIIPYSQEQHENSTKGLGLNDKQPLLLAQSNPRNLSIESLRSLRTSLQVHLSCARNNIISILGVMPGVGKTFVSTNLAYLLATAGKRVLLIDADLRRGTTHRYFNVPSSPGLAELIQGNITPTDALKATTHENLVVLPRGNYPDDPSELLSNKNFKNIIESFGQQFDIAIIDTAPVLLVTDAVLIGSISSINYLVLGSGVHQPADIEMTIKRLSAANVGINGSIFNFHNASSGKNPYYRKYYSYKQYYVT